MAVEFFGSLSFTYGKELIIFFILNFELALSKCLEEESWYIIFLFLSENDEEVICWIVGVSTNIRDDIEGLN